MGAALVIIENKTKRKRRKIRYCYDGANFIDLNENDPAPVLYEENDPTIQNSLYLQAVEKNGAKKPKRCGWNFLTYEKSNSNIKFSLSVKWFNNGEYCKLTVCRITGNEPPPEINVTISDDEN